MRLGQLARKYDIPVQDIIDYLEDESDPVQSFHPNSKLEEEKEKELFDHFGIEHPVEEVEEKIMDTPEEKPIEEEIPEPIVDEQIVPQPEVTHATAAEEIAAVEGELADLPVEPVEKESKVELVQEVEPEVEAPQIREDEVIQTDQLLEMLESEEEPVDLEKIKLIKAPKRELSGLKVLGKVDLPEPKKKEEKSEEQKQQARKRTELSEEEREKRRLKAKRKQEAYEARNERRKKEQERRKKKAKNTAHYQQQVKKGQSQKHKPKGNQNELPTAKAQSVQKPKPKTWIGKFIRWLNTP